MRARIGPTVSPPNRTSAWQHACTLPRLVFPGLQLTSRLPDVIGHGQPGLDRQGITTGHGHGGLVNSLADVGFSLKSQAIPFRKAGQISLHCDVRSLACASVIRESVTGVHTGHAT